MKIKKVDSDKILFTSDLHFWHKNIIQFAKRPYFDVEEMNEGIIKNWNKKVVNTDTVFILGDVSWVGLQNTEHLLDQLNGEKILIIGNHDPSSIISYFNESYEMLGLDITDVEEGRHYECHLCHYPLAEWLGDRRRSLMLHGHCHGTMDEVDKYNSRRLDVGLDSHNMEPITWNEIKKILNKRLENAINQA